MLYKTKTEGWQPMNRYGARLTKAQECGEVMLAEAMRAVAWSELPAIVAKEAAAMGKTTDEITAAGDMIARLAHMEGRQ